VNALWKDVYLLKFASTEKVLQLVDIVTDVVKYMKILSVSNLEKEVLKISYRARFNSIRHFIYSPSPETWTNTSD